VSSNFVQIQQLTHNIPRFGGQRELDDRLDLFRLESLGTLHTLALRGNDSFGEQPVYLIARSQ
jgi:hypothetical protein